MKILNFLKNDPRIKNSLWMIIEKSISLFGLVFVISAMAKYIGAELYGYIAWGTSIFLIIKSMAQLGLDQIYFKKIGKNNTKSSKFLKSSIYLILLIYINISILVIFFLSFKLSSTAIYLILSISIANMFLAIDIRSIHLDAILISKINVISNIIGLGLSLITRYLIILMKLDTWYFCIPILILAIVPYFIRVYIVRKKNILNNEGLNFYEFKKYATYILKVGLPLMLSIVSVNIYLQSASLFMGYWGMIREVGIYSIAITLASCWCFIPTTLIMSFLPKIYQEKNITRYIEKAGVILRWLLIINALIVIFLYLISDFIILNLYGVDFERAAPILKLALVSSFLSVIGFFFYKMAIKFGGYGFLAKKMALTCFFNVVISYFLIKKYGINGAVYAIVLTEFISNIIFNLYYSEMKMLRVFKYALLGRV